MLDEKKRELCNIRRLEALKAKKQEKNVQTEQIKASLRNLDLKTGAPLNKKTVFQSDESDDDSGHSKDGSRKRKNTMGSSKLSLFPSDNEEDEQDNIHQLKTRPEFKGSEFFEETGDERFRLSKIFMEDSGEEDQVVEPGDDEKNEKQKNMEILESVLGFQLPSTVPVAESNEAKKKKKYMRFNPEDENSEMYLRKTKSKEEEKKFVEKEAKTASAVHEPQVSPARYFEVSADLKSALQGTKEDFQLSKMFGFSNEETKANDDKFCVPEELQDNRPTLNEQSDVKNKKADSFWNAESTSLTFTGSSRNEKYSKFFIMPGDPRLTESINFFKRKKPVEEIYADFNKTRDLVLDIFKRRHRRGLRTPYVFKNKR